MTASLTKTASSKKTQASPAPREKDLLDSLPLLLASLSRAGVITPLNKSAQDFWGKAQLIEGPIRAMAARVWESGEGITAHDFSLVRHLKEYRATLHITLLNDESLLVTMDLKGAPHAPSASTWKSEITRAAGVMAAMMAHEVKNPLSSIRGAAQLLKETVKEDEKPLADLIVDETLRIRDLLDQMEVFSDERVVELTPFNIHEVLQYSMNVAKAGFAANVTFIEKYDPSLPPVFAHRDSLVQLFLNIIKNASEALGDSKYPAITLSTSYQSGLKMTDKKLPLVVHISDNGKGIPADIRKKLFEPFVSTKAQGRGLGLAVVAKLASDIGAIVECIDPVDQVGARFAIYLPISE